MLAGVDGIGPQPFPAAKSRTNRTLLAVPYRDAGPYPLTGPTYRTNSHPPEDIDHAVLPSGGGTAVAGYSANGIPFDLWGRAGLSSSGNISF